ncbi:MAG: beta strand repeat-containing protein, partial [Alphaproteobacteria bacterium]
TTKDSLVANAASLTLNAAALTATNSLTFDASAETNGSFVLTGGAGDDIITMGLTLNAQNQLDGGAGSDTLTFTDNGQGTDELDNVLNFEAITLGDATTNLVTKDSLIDDGASLSIDARAITTTNSLTFNAAQETNGSIILNAGLGANDVTLGGHNDNIYFDDTLTSLDRVVGGAGDDTLYFTDNGLGTDELNNVTQIENIVFGNAATSIVTVDALVGTGLALDLDASALDAGNSFTLRASQESDGSISLTAGVGAVDLVMGQSDDTIVMGTYLDASDVIDGGSGNDTLNFTGDWTSTDRLDNVTNVENIVLGDNETKLVLTDNLVGLGQTVKITAEAVSATNYVNIIAEAETGSLHLIGGAGGDQFFMGEYLDASDIIDGGSGTDNLFFTDGNGATNELDNVTGIENISLGDATTNLIVTNNFVSQGTAIALVATNLSASSSLTFDASAELDGYITVMAGQGVDDITLGQLNDTIYMDDNLTSADQIDGAAGEDTLHFTYTGVNTNLLDQVTNFEAIVLGDAATNLVLTNNLVSNGGTTTINGSSLSSSNNLVIDASSETDGTVNVTGGAGDDIITMGSTLDDQNQLDGGDGADILVFSDADVNTKNDLDQVTNIETIKLGNVATDVVTLDSLIAANVTLKILGDVALTQDIKIDASAETDGHIDLFTGSGDDRFTAGQGKDIIRTQGGDDIVYMGQNLTKDDIVDGGTNTATGDILHFTDNNGASNDLDQVTNFEKIVLGDATSSVTTLDQLITQGETLIVDASSISAGNSLTFNATAETNGHIDITGGAGADIIKTGSGNDLIDGFGGADQITTGTGSDVITVTLTGQDNTINDAVRIKDFEDGVDKIDIVGTDASNVLITSGQGSFTGTTVLSFNNGQFEEILAIIEGIDDSLITNNGVGADII